MSDLKPFLVPPPDDSALNHPEALSNSNLEKLSKLHSLTEPERKLSEEQINMYQEAVLSDTAQLIRHLDPKLEEHQSALERQVKAIEQISHEAHLQSESAKVLSDIATAKANKADIKSWIAIAISLIAVCVEIILNRSELAAFFQSFI